MRQGFLGIILKKEKEFEMDISCKTEGNAAVAYLCGEIDHHNAVTARAALDEMIEQLKPIRFGLDLSGVSFCDSSGLGLVMGRMRKFQSVGSSMFIKNPSNAALKMLEIAGMDRIIKIERGKADE